jgi:antitoxin ParD1/3/4
MAIITISLPKSLKQFVDAQVASKGYGDASEYLCSLVREAQQAETDARLEALLLEGLASGDPIPIDEKFCRKLRADTDRLIRARKTGRKSGNESGKKSE